MAKVILYAEDIANGTYNPEDLNGAEIEFRPGSREQSDHESSPALVTRQRIASSLSQILELHGEQGLRDFIRKMEAANGAMDLPEEFLNFRS